MIIREPRWTKPALLLPGQSLRLVCDNAPDAPLEAQLEKNGMRIGLRAGRTTTAAGAAHVFLDRVVPETVPEGLYGLEVRAGGGRAVAPNSVRVLRRFKDPFTFLHTSDLHLIGRMPDGRIGDRSAVAEKLVDAINSLRPEFVINTGDIISRYGKDSHDVLPPENVAWQAKRAREVLLGLEVPMFVTPGNHDLAFEWCRGPWMTHMGGPRGRETDDYGFEYGEYHFASLDGSVRYDEETLEPTGMGFSAGQLSWLADDVQRAAGSRLRFLFYHYDYGRRLDSHLRELRVNMVLYGHSKAIGYGGDVTDGHLPGIRAYQLVTVEGGRISVQAGPLYRELAGRGSS